MKDNFYKIAIVLAKRRKTKEKRNFLLSVSNYLEKQNIKTITAEDEANKGRFYLMTDNIDKAGKVVFAPYATLNKSLLNIPYYPLSKEKRNAYEIQSAFVHVGLVILLLLLEYVGYQRYSSYLLKHPVLLAIVCLVYNYFVLTLSIGLPNYINYHQAGTICIWLELLQNHNKNICYVLYDSKENNYAFCSRYVDKYKKEDSEIFILENICMGNEVFVASGENDQNIDDKMIDQDLIPGLKNVHYVTSGNENKSKEIYIKNYRTNRNQKVDFDFLETAYKKIEDIIDKRR